MHTVYAVYTVYTVYIAYSAYGRSHGSPGDRPAAARPARAEGLEGGELPKVQQGLGAATPLSGEYEEQRPPGSILAFFRYTAVSTEVPSAAPPSQEENI